MTEMIRAELAATTVRVGRWKCYSAYKDSEVEWLGEIPVHWNIERLKNTVLACQNGIWGDEPANDTNDIVCIRVADFDRTRNRVNNTALTFRSIPSDQRRNRVLEPGDLLLEKSGGGELQPVGVVVLYDLDTPAVCSNFIARMPIARAFDPSFLCYFHSVLYAARVNTRSIKQNTGIQNLDSDNYLCEKVCTPPLPEQRTIAAFLDRETAKINALIAKKERLIELLQEKRTALISHGVTKGLDPGAQMKNSGVEWLGDIPAHWEITPVKYLSYIISKGTTPTTIGKEFLEEGIRFIKAENISDGGVSNEPAIFIDQATNNLLRRSILHAYDILMVIAGATTGKVAVIYEDQLPANTNQAVAFIRLKDWNHARFILFWLGSSKIQEQVWLKAVQAAQPNLSLEDIGNFIAPVPPASEISEITKYLDSETAKIDALISRIRQGIEKLKEYSTALISAAVTGKIDVRDEVSSSLLEDKELD